LALWLGLARVPLWALVLRLVLVLALRLVLRLVVRLAWAQKREPVRRRPSAERWLGWTS
jgi:hypothetical protein